MMELIASLSDAFGPPGFEHAVRQIILSHIEQDHVSHSIDALGNLYVTNIPQTTPRLLIASGMDEVGFFVTSHDEKGRLYFAPIGKLHMQHLYGCIACLGGDTKGIFVKSGDHWLIDIGAQDADQARRKAPVGTVGALAMTAQVLSSAPGQRLAGKALQRCLAAALASVMQKDTLPRGHWVAAFLAQKEPSARGARVVGEHWQAQRIISLEAVDCNAEDGNNLEIGGGPVLVLRAAHFCSDPRWAGEIISIARDRGVALQRYAGDQELVMSERLQTSGKGAATACLALPVRYLDSPWQMVDTRDVAQLADVLTACLPEKK